MAGGGSIVVEQVTADYDIKGLNPARASGEDGRKTILLV